MLFKFQMTCINAIELLKYIQEVWSHIDEFFYDVYKKSEVMLMNFSMQKIVHNWKSSYIVFPGQRPYLLEAMLPTH